MTWNRGRLLIRFALLFALAGLGLASWIFLSGILMLVGVVLMVAAFYGMIKILEG